MQIEFEHGEPATVAWQEGELVTVQITKVEGTHYTAETVETVPPDIREQHRLELERLQQQHHDEIVRASGGPPGAPAN